MVEVRLTPADAQQLRTMRRQLAEIVGPQPGGRRRMLPEQHAPRWLAQITGHDTIGTTTIRWKYAWTEVEIDGDGIATVIDGRSGTTSEGYALNLCELANTAEPAAGDPWVGGDGVNMHGTDYPAGFEMQPVGAGPANDGSSHGTHRTDVVVEMWYMRDASGDMRPVFDRVNTHDGTCEVPT